jgi:surface antigen Omp85-like protein
MRRHRILCLALAAAAIAWPSAALAQTLDVGDLWRSARHKDEPRGDGDESDADTRSRFFVVAPTIGSKPTTGLTGGLNSNMAFFSGDPDTTHISSLSGGMRVSQKGQVLSGVRYAIFTPDDRWFVQGDNRLSWTSLNTYALGAVPMTAGTENVKFDAVRLYETAYRHIRRGLFYGIGINVNAHANVRPGDGVLAPWDESAYVSYNERHGFSPERQVSSGTSVALLYDTRDNAINAGRGVLASTTYRTFFGGLLGGDSTWQELSVDLRTYKPLSHNGQRKLAFWMLGDFVTGGVAPYFDLPATGGDGRSARGYADGRYRGEHLLYGEVEYRSTLTKNGLLGFVTFLNTTTVSSTETRERLFGAYAPAAGAGLRVLMNKRSRTNLCADYGVGKAGSRGFYLSIQEAF